MVSRLSVAALVALAVVPSTAFAAGENGHANVSVTAQFAARTSLKVSTSVLQFVVAGPGEHAVAVVEFSAAARTRGDGEVLLTVEPVRGAGEPLPVSMAGSGEAPRDLPVGGPCVAQRWTGSGRRSGSLTFVLRDAAPGTYTLPVQFVLTTP